MVAGGGEKERKTGGMAARFAIRAGDLRGGSVMNAPNGRINGRKMMPRPAECSRLRRNFVKPIMLLDVGQILRLEYGVSLKIVYGTIGRLVAADVSAALQISNKPLRRKFNVCYRS